MRANNIGREYAAAVILFQPTYLGILWQTAGTQQASGPGQLHRDQRRRDCRQAECEGVRIEGPAAIHWRLMAEPASDSGNHVRVFVRPVATPSRKLHRSQAAGTTAWAWRPRHFRRGRAAPGLAARTRHELNSARRPRHLLPVGIATPHSGQFIGTMSLAPRPGNIVPVCLDGASGNVIGGTAASRKVISGNAVPAV